MHKSTLSNTAIIILAKNEKLLIRSRSHDISRTPPLNSSTNNQNLPGLRFILGDILESLSLGLSGADEQFSAIIFIIIK